MKLSPSARKWVRGVVDYGGLVAFLIGFFLNRGGGMTSQEALVQATWWLVGGSLLGLVVGFVFEKRIAPFPLIAGGAALVFGGLTLFFHDVRFVKLKPTVMNTLFGVALLGGLVLRKNPLKLLLGDAVKMPDVGWRKLTLNYGLFFLALAALNEFVWRTQPDDVWVVFRFPGLLILTVLFGFAQVPLMMKYAKTDEPPPPHVE
ncbi:intracellular septation protein [Phenylobacterium haematophilum]|uniref:Inner membrane-spanning protein YciB n=1 Tax=Phenylobacterium haematophilum TaxID=98513 RepID=A0A840A0Y5_9CAUL|nr:inner membrane-spanning protein YciB [Phenylobacterium haematophilum]MBB3892575.1 intracellular septation protein [Phenylobacterium haematophilum]